MGRKKGWGGPSGGGDLTLGGERAIEHTDGVLQNCTLETYLILLTNVTFKEFNKKEIKNKNKHLFEIVFSRNI